MDEATARESFHFDVKQVDEDVFLYTATSAAMQEVAEHTGNDDKDILHWSAMSDDIVASEIDALRKEITFLTFLQAGRRTLNRKKRKA